MEESRVSVSEPETNVVLCDVGEILGSDDETDGRESAQVEVESGSDSSWKEGGITFFVHLLSVSARGTVDLSSSSVSGDEEGSDSISVRVGEEGLVDGDGRESLVDDIS